MVTELVAAFAPVEGCRVSLPSNRPVVGTCPRCGREVTENPKGFFCENPRCRFALWRDNRFFYKQAVFFDQGESPGVAPTRGSLCRTPLLGENRSYYDATIVLDTSAPVPRYFLKYGQ